MHCLTALLSICIVFSQGIVEWLLKKTGPPAKEVKTVEEVEELKTESDVVVVGFFKDQESEGAQKFKEVAQGKNKYHFRSFFVAD